MGLLASTIEGIITRRRDPCTGADSGILAGSGRIFLRTECTFANMQHLISHKISDAQCCPASVPRIGVFFLLGQGVRPPPSALVNDSVHD